MGVLKIPFLGVQIKKFTKTTKNQTRSVSLTPAKSRLLPSEFWYRAWQISIHVYQQYSHLEHIQNHINNIAGVVDVVGCGVAIPISQDDHPSNH